LLTDENFETLDNNGKPGRYPLGLSSSIFRVGRRTGRRGLAALVQHIHVVLTLTDVITVGSQTILESFELVHACILR